MVRELYKGYYKHFKELNEYGDELVYYVHDVCMDTETGDIKVFYEAMYGDQIRYVREISMFLSKVDKTKYPNTNQEFRFEMMTADEVSEWKKRLIDDINIDRKSRFTKTIED